MTANPLPFDLVVLDLDGTIIDLYESAGIRPVVLATVAAVQAAGIPVTIATGRSLDYVRAHIGGLGVTTPVVTTQGAVIGDPVTGHILAERDIPLAAARRIADWAETSGRYAVFYFHDEEGRTVVFESRSDYRHPEAFHDYVFGAQRSLHSLRDLVAAPDAKSPVKFMTLNDLKIEADVEPELQQQFGQSVYITRTHPMLVEGTALGINKGEGVRQLCTLLGIDPQRVLAIGDSNNDIPLLEAVGMAVAMGNATEGVKAAADWIAPSIEEDGAAVALQELILARLQPER